MQPVQAKVNLKVKVKFYKLTMFLLAIKSVIVTVLNNDIVCFPSFSSFHKDLEACLSGQGHCGMLTSQTIR